MEDQLVVRGKFLKGLVEKALEKLVREKFDEEVLFSLEALSLITDESRTIVHVDVSLIASNDDVTNLLNKLF